VSAILVGDLFVLSRFAGLSPAFCERLASRSTCSPPGTRAAVLAPGFLWEHDDLDFSHSLRRLIASVLGAIFMFALSFLPVVGDGSSAIGLRRWFAARARLR